MAKPIVSPSFSSQGSYAVSTAAPLSSVIALMLSAAALVFSLQSRHEPALRSTPAAPVVTPMVSEPAIAEEVPPASDQGRIRAMADYLGKRYLVSAAAIHRLVEMAFSVGREVNLDPLLILAVMAVESRFNPIAESVAGAQGLMQIIPRYHADKVPESQPDASFLDPRVNVLVGAKVLKDYIGRSGGNLQTGLQMYNGAPSDAGAQYANKVIAEKDRLRQVFSQRGRNGT